MDAKDTTNRNLALVCNRHFDLASVGKILYLPEVGFSLCARIFHVPSHYLRLSAERLMRREAKQLLIGRERWPRRAAETALQLNGKSAGDDC